MVNSKRIIKNSLWLYLRMLVVTIVALYTSRVVLKVLGVDDFGIYNVTGNLVAFFSVLTTTMSSSTQRFLNIKKGENDINGMKCLMGISRNIHLFLSLLIIALAETVGVYMLFYVMVFPSEKIMEAFLCFQSSVIALVFTIFRVPYVSMVVTYEKFAFIAWTSLADVAIKLLMVFALMYFEKYRLVYYGCSFTLMSIIQYVLFRYYGNRLCKSINIKLRDTFKSAESRSLLSFSSWNMMGNISNVLANQGIGIVLNMFYALAVNAAMGITNQITNTIATFVNNVQQAFRPQLLQSYANEDKTSFLSLLYSTSRWSYYLILLIAVPIVVNIDYILHLWLGNYPQYTNTFAIILVAFLVIDSLGTPLLFGIEANGKVRNFQILMSLAYIANVVFAYTVCKIGMSPNIAILTKLVTNALIYIIKCMELRKVETTFSILDYSQNVLFKLTPVSIWCMLYLWITKDMESSLEKLLISTIVFLLLYILVLFFGGLNSQERKFCMSKIKSIKLL